MYISHTLMYRRCNHFNSVMPVVCHWRKNNDLGKRLHQRTYGHVRFLEIDQMSHSLTSSRRSCNVFMYYSWLENILVLRISIRFCVEVYKIAIEMLPSFKKMTVLWWTCYQEFEHIYWYMGFKEKRCSLSKSTQIVCK